MAKIAAMGEIMLRLSTPNSEEFVQADEFGINYGGGEANVAVSLANYGHDVQFVAAIPENPIGDCAATTLRKYNVRAKHIAHSGERLGVYFLETGSVMRASNVIYDRVNSAITTATPGEFNFNEIFADADWLHFTGVTPVVSDAAIALTETALKVVKAHDVAVSVDLNFHKKLWSSERAQKIMINLMQYVDVCIGNKGDAERALDSKPGNTDITSGELELADYVDIFNQMADKLGFKCIISPLHENYSASGSGQSACIMDGKTREFYHSRRCKVTPIMDRVGGGDSFAGGLICGLADDKDVKAVLGFAVAVSALEHTIPDDFNLMSCAGVDNLTGGDGSGRAQRQSDQKTEMIGSGSGRKK